MTENEFMNVKVGDKIVINNDLPIDYVEKIVSTLESKTNMFLNFFKEPKEVIEVTNDFVGRHLWFSENKFMPIHAISYQILIEDAPFFNIIEK